MANLPFSIESLLPHLKHVKSTDQVYSVAQGMPPVVDLPTSNETSVQQNESRRSRLHCVPKFVAGFEIRSYFGSIKRAGKEILKISISGGHLAENYSENFQK